MESVAPLSASTLVAPSLAVAPSFPVVVQSTQLGAAAVTTHAAKVVDTYVENHPRVVAARERHAELNRIGDRLCGIGVTPATLGVIGGLTSTMAALTGHGEWWLPAFCAAVVGAGAYITHLHGRLWNAAIEPARNELELARREVRSSLGGPEDVHAVAEQLAPSK